MKFFKRTLYLCFLAVLSSFFCVYAQSPGGVSANLNFWIEGNSSAYSNVATSTLATDQQAINGWKDLSTKGYSATQASSASYEPSYRNNTTDNINFNPVVMFDGNATYMDIGNGALASGNAKYTVYALLKPGPANNSHPGKFLFSGDNTGNDYFCAFDVRGTNNINDSWNNDDNLSPNNSYTTNYPLLTTFIDNGTSRYIYAFGKSISTYTNNYTRVSPATNSAIGCQRSVAASAPFIEYYQGAIAEEISYVSVSHTATQQNEVETYLGIKYGVTLLHNYLSSAGTTVWNLATNAAYNSNIIGLARDDASGLMQKQSFSSQPTSDILTDYISSLVQPNQAANTGTFASGDKSFLLTGTNGLGVTGITTENPPNITKTLAREWFSQQTNFTNTDLSFNFDLTTVTSFGSLNQIALLLDNDGNFTNATVLTPSACAMQVNGNVITVTISASQLTTTPYFTLGVMGPALLPVTLTAFSGQQMNNSVKLNWTTAQEINNNYFVVERSTDGQDFTAISPNIMGAGNSSIPHSYTYTDNQQLYTNNYYYRLKQVDFNGKYSYSNIVNVDVIQFISDVVIIPMPVQDLAMVKFSSARSGALNGSIYDITGREVRKIENTNMEKGANTMTIDLTNLPIGAYFLTLTSNAGFQKNIKLIKQ